VGANQGYNFESRKHLSIRLLDKVVELVQAKKIKGENWAEKEKSNQTLIVLLWLR
jgi:hypothetical protein